MIIGYKDITETRGDHTFSTFASDIELAPGHWPARLETEIGNGQPLVRAKLDAVGAVYRQALGIITLNVFNNRKTMSCYRFKFMGVEINSCINYTDARRFSARVHDKLTDTGRTELPWIARPQHFPKFHFSKENFLSRN